MDQSEINQINREDLLKNWRWFNPGDPGPEIRKHLDVEQVKQIATRDLDLKIKIMEHELETMKMTNQMLKKKV